MGFAWMKNKDKLKEVFVKYNSAMPAQKTFQILKKYISKKDSVLNIGAGTCVLDEKFVEEGHKITPIDIYDGSLSDKVAPIVYDGRKIPAKNKSYSVALLMSVLHHVPDQKELLNEAVRVADRVIVQEDLVGGHKRKKAYSIFDNFINCDFNFNKNNYHSLEEWKQIFSELGLEICGKEKKKSYFVVDQAVFVLKPKAGFEA